MKIKMFFAMLVAALGLSSCSSDDESKINLSKEVVGNYSGYTVSTCDYFSYMGAANENLTIVSNDETAVTVSFTSKTWGTFSINSAKVENMSSGYQIKGAGTCSMGHGTSMKEYDCSLEAIINKEKESTLTFSVPSVMGGMTIIFSTGKTPDNISASCSNEGKFSLMVAGMSMGDVDTTLKIEATEDGNATVKIGAFDVDVAAMGTSFSFGEMVIKGMTVTANADGSYSVAGELQDCIVDMNGSKVAVTGNFEGTVVDGKVSGTLTFKPGSMPMNIIGTFVSNPN